MRGLHILWCVNLTTFSFVVQWYENNAIDGCGAGRCSAQPLWEPGCGGINSTMKVDPGVVHSILKSQRKGRVQRSLMWSLWPIKIDSE